LNIVTGNGNELAAKEEFEIAVLEACKAENNFPSIFRASLVLKVLMRSPK